MKEILCCLLIIGTIILSICNAAPLDSNEETARKYVEEVSTNLFAYYDKLAADTLGLETEDLETFFNALQTLLTKSELMTDIFGNASKFSETQFKDEELNYIFNNLKKSADESILGGERYFEILTAMGNLEDLAADEDIDGYKNKSIQLAYFPGIQNVFQKSSDPEELKYYWEMWREKNDKWAMQSFLVLVDGIKDAAKLAGTSAYDFWMKDFNMTQMDDVMKQIEPFYKKLHGFVRHQLNKKYGDAVINTKGLIPDHLFQQVLAQAWTKDSVVEDVFPQKDLPNYQEILFKQNYDTLKLFKTADKFYESLGLQAVPENYWGTKLKMRTSEDEGDCKATILAQSPSVYMQYCHKMDFRTFLQAHGFMAQVHFALEKSGLPAYYFDSYYLDNAVGEAVILSASSLKHLREVGILAGIEITDEMAANRNMRMSIHSVLNIPLYYVHTKVMADLLSGKIEMTELNKRYWELMDQYVGVGPPGDRLGNNFDFPIKFYLDFNKNEQARKFYSEVLSYQLFKKFCELSGKSYSDDLRNCDFYGSKAVGDVLKKMIKLGSSKPVDEVLATVLPENLMLDGEDLLDYYCGCQK